MKHIVRSAILIVAAMVGSALALLALLALATNLSIYASEPADFLPQEKTLLLFHEPDSATIQLLSDTFPAVKKLSAPTPKAIAILRFENEYESVAFTDQKEQTHRVGPYGITVSNPLLLPHISAQANTLGRQADYKKLRSTVPQHASWLYTSLQQPQEFGLRILRNLLGHQTYVAITPQADDVRIAVTPAPTPKRYGAKQQVPPMKQRILAISTSSAYDTWEQWKSHLTQQDGKVLESILRAQTTFLGKGVSFEYDVLPLFEESNVLQVSQSGSHVFMLLSGEMKDEEVLNTIVDHMHTSYANTLPTTRVTKRVLDKRFSTVDLRHDEEMIESIYRPIGDWYVLGTARNGEKEGLFTAIKGTHFLLSQNEDVLLYALQNKQEELAIPTLQEPNVLTSLTWLKTERVADLLDGRLPALSQFLRLQESQTLTAASVWKSDVQTWIIQSPDISSKLLDSLL